MVMVTHCQFVTDGGTDMTQITSSVIFAEVCISLDVWDNSTRFDLKVFGRYVKNFPMALGPWRTVYTQDDDCILPRTSIHSLIHAYEPGVVTCNLPAHRRPEYSDGIALVGWGAIFDRNLTSVFNLYFKHFSIDELFLTECDRVFTGLNKVKLIDVPFTHLPHATALNRLSNRPDHWDCLAEIRRRIHHVKKKEGL